MDDTTKTALVTGLATGYLLGRTKKARIAFAVATYVAGRRFGLNPRDLAAQGVRKLRENPQFAELGDRVSGDLVDAGRAAAVAAVSRRLGSLTETLQERNAALRAAAGGPPSGREEPEEEPEEDEESEEPEEGEEPEEEPEPEEEDEEPEEEPEPEEEDEEPEEEKPEPSPRAGGGKAKKRDGGRRSPAKKAPAKKTAAGKTTSKKSTAKKAAAKKSTAKKSTAKKTARKTTRSSTSGSRGRR
ncbi:hypothetical protein GCM10027160_19970 [Streptomyces calidiresistens]